MRAIHVMPALSLQKPSKRSESKEHGEKGVLLKLFEEAEAIQSRMPINNEKRDMASGHFKKVQRTHTKRKR